ncbi:MAG: patatin-like phospholipase family protein [Burkholderiales bacterium]
MTKNGKTGLILTGGGARAAYQVGVLRAIADLLINAGWPAEQNPFPVICGTSAGAINAAALACNADNFGVGLRRLERIWSTIEAHHVYRADSIAMLRSGASWLSLLSFGWMMRRWIKMPPSSLFDNSPLVDLLNKMLDFSGLDAGLASGSLEALAITASSYTTGMHLTFYQTLKNIEPWVRSQRLAQRDFISVQHLLASSAIPFIFPSIPLNWSGGLEYCGDGSMRQLAPISPAIHLGAQKVFIIGAGRMSETKRKVPEKIAYPSIAQIAGHAMSSIFLDSLAMDIERMTRINRTLSMLPEEKRNRAELRPIEILVIAPSERLDDIATRHVKSLPAPIRAMLGVIGATETRGAALASYLLFEPGFTNELMALGFADAMKVKDDVLAFFIDVPATSRD